ncbi:glutathione S-transferase family protein [Sphingomonas sp. C3-2]|uniref:glutathione S-transferase family protein n=1 Tax=Sphingomonas sp. C3-2 TaxID=3062169 RepID=UPI00294B4286|nr:glutathione S-transferase family protein [Sphingomonas sp. C3-2]WOK36294.1 glutathione S-transferase family protein [Sphingomonas sp. C3-2]
MKLFGASLSPYVRKVLAYAAEKGIELELVPGGMGQGGAEFEELSPFGKMPAFRDGDYGLCDSSAIIAYLEAKHPEPPLIPADPKARGKTIWYDEFGDTIVMGAGAKIFFNRLVAPRILKIEGDMAAADAAERTELPRIYDYLERVIPASGFLVEDRLTLADLAVASPFANLGHLGLMVDTARWPRTAAYVDAILARPSFAGWVERERKWISKG